MELNEYLEKIAKRFAEVAEEEKGVKDRRSHLRDEFFRLLDETWRGKEYMLPIKTIEVPDSFFASTGISKEDFIKTRFPGWDVEHCEANISLHTTVFVLKRNPRFMSNAVEIELNDNLFRVSKEVAEFTPEIDWDTLRVDRPDLFNKLARRVIVYELDEDELTQMMVDSPEDLAALQRHMKVKEPQLRAIPREVKK